MAKKINRKLRFGLTAKTFLEHQNNGAKTFLKHKNNGAKTFLKHQNNGAKTFFEHLNNGATTFLGVPKFLLPGLVNR